MNSFQEMNDTLNVAVVHAEKSELGDCWSIKMGK